MPGLGSLATRAPGWLRAALGLAEADVPNELLLDGIRGVIDVGQGGHAYGMDHQAAQTTTIVASTAAQPSLTLLAASDDVQRLVTGFHVNNYGAGAVNWTLIVYLSQPQSGGAGAIGQATVAPKASSTVQGTSTMKDFFGIAAPIWIPPGNALVVWAPATVANQQVDIRVTYMNLPSGYKPF